MHVIKFLATAAVAAAFAGQALAQCTNYPNTQAGTLIMNADEAIRTVALPFSFPFDDALGAHSYTSMTFSSNGWIKFGTPSTTSAELSETSALMTGGNPRLAFLWDDLSSAAASTTGSGNVYYTATPTQATLTFQGVQRFGSTQTGTKANCECVLMANGDIYFYYDATCTFNLANSGSIVGISSGALGGAVATTVDWSTLTTPTAITNATAFQVFTTTAPNIFDLQNAAGSQIYFQYLGGGNYNATYSTPSTLPTCGLGGYIPVASPPTIVGTGCSQLATVNSLCELFTVDTGTSPFDLANTSIKFTAVGTSYVSGPGLGYDSNYTATAGLTTYGDDTTTTGHSVGAMGSFPMGSTSYTQISICSNGYLWLGTNTFASFTPSLSVMATGGARVAPFFSDLAGIAYTAGTPPGTGIIYYNTGSNYLGTGLAFAQVTWENFLERSTAGSSVNCQATLCSNGDIYIAYGSVSAAGTHTRIAGINGGTGGTAPLSSDLATGGVPNVLGPVNMVVTPGFTAMSHTVSTAILGTTFNMASTVPSNHSGIGLFGVGMTNPGLPLDAIFGTGTAPGCTLYTDGSQDLIFPIPITAGATSFNLNVYVPIPALNYLAGIVAFTQAGAVGPWNAANVISSNGRTFMVGL